MARPTTTIATLRDRVLPEFKKNFPPDRAASLPRADIAREAKQTVAEFLGKNRIDLNLLDQRDLVTALVNSTVVQRRAAGPPPAPPEPAMPEEPREPPRRSKRRRPCRGRRRSK